jgi:ABC-type transporter Mla subunit MlaD
VESSSDRLDTIIGLTQKATADYSRIVQEASTFSQSAQDLNVLIRTLEENKQHLMAVSQSLAQLLREASGSLPSVEKKVIELTDTLADTMSRHQRTVGETLTRNSELTRSSLEETTKGLSRISAATEQQVKDLETKLGEALEECLSSLGSQLTALSERFVEDYTPLTIRLRQLVHMTPAE